METKLSIENPEDWYRISRQLVQNFGGESALRRFGIFQMLKIVYPDVKWDEDKLLRRNKKASQFFLKRILEKMYPNNIILEDYKHPNIKFDTSYSCELDLYLPELNLAFEYNGEHHYMDNPVYGPCELYQQKDKEKAEKCKENGISLIIIPYWWNEQPEFIIEKIKEDTTNDYKTLLPKD